MTTNDMTDERIHVIAEHKHIADLWVRLNADALRREDDAVRIVTTGSAVQGRGVTSSRLIIIGRPDNDLVYNAEIGCRIAPAQVIRLSHLDRLAAGWRTA